MAQKTQAIMSRMTECISLSRDSFADGFTKQKTAKYAAELIGTAWLVLLIKLSVPNFENPSITIGLGLACIIYTYGYISKAHYNPSITLAFTLRNSEEWPSSDICQIIMYYIMEYVGAIIGGLLGWLIGGRESALVYPTAVSDGSSASILFRAFMAELIFTFILAAVILHVATDKRQANNQFYGVSIGGTVTASIMCIGKISGSCLNSAVWLGCVVPALLVSLADNSDIDLSDAWIYWTAPFIGAALSALIFNLIFREAVSCAAIDGDDKKPVPESPQCVSSSSVTPNDTAINGVSCNANET